MRIKKLKDQVIVITGASSGIGLSTALMAGERGATVVLASRNTEDLHRIVGQIEASGGRALAVTVDVSKQEDVTRLKEVTLESFGRIDTWVNNAGTGIYGYVLENPMDEAKQVFETNFWGLHYGCIAAVEAMKETGGVIVNLGSEASERAAALQVMYSATKGAIKVYTEGLRNELQYQKIPVKLSLIRPASMATPYTEHGVNHLDSGEPSLPAPVYHPDIAANAILHCAQTGKRDVYIGFPSKFAAIFNHISPQLIDVAMTWKFMNDQKKGTRKAHERVNEALMQAPPSEGRVVGDYKGHVSTTSLWTSMSLNPYKTALALMGAAAGLYWLSKGRKNHVL